MKKILLLALLLIGVCGADARSAPLPAAPKSDALVFIENVGQITDQHLKQRKDVRFKLQQENFTVLLSDKGIHYQWNKAEGIDPQNLRNHTAFQVNHYRMDVELIGANPKAEIISGQQASYYERYYLEHLGLKGQTARAFEQVTYKDIYPGIDWVLYVSKDKVGKEQLKYDFIVHPGADPAKIRLKYKGAGNVAINKDGSLSASTPMGTITEAAPYTYVMQGNKAGQGQMVSSRYELKDNVLSFKTDAYSGTLVIDPSLEWGTYYGGAGFDLGTVLACDFAGNIYLTGASWMGTNIATSGSHQSTSAGDFDAFLAKFDANGNRIWATYYGGSSVDYSFGLACDQNNRVFISGTTQSLSGIATVGSHQATYAGSTDNYLARFDSAGVLLWATYYGSSGSEYNGICAVDESGHVYLAGYTAGSNNIASNGHQSSNGGGINDAYLAKFDTSGLRIWGTYYGGSGSDEADGIACDLMGNVYLGGNTNSPNNIATAGSHQPVLGGLYDNFLVKFNPNGQRQWATYYGGTGNEFNGYMRTVACDKAGNVYTCGHSQSASGIATAGSHQPALAGGYDAYLVKFNTSGQRAWGTYYGGAGDENGGAIAIDFSDKIFWSGITTSTSGIITADAQQVNFGGGPNDAFLSRFSGAGILEYGTYYGGSETDEGYAVGFDFIGNAYISGGTNSSTNIATPGSFSTVFGGGIAVYLAKFCTSVAATQIGGPDTLCANAIATFFATPLQGASAYIWDIPSGWSGSSNTSSITLQTNGTGGTVSVSVVRCDTSATQSLQVHVVPEIPAQIVVNNMVLSTLNTHSAYQWIRDGVAISGATNATYTVTQDGLYTVAVANPYCNDTSDAVLFSGGVGFDDPAKVAAQIKVFPNPAMDKVYLRTDADFRLRLLGIDGRVHLESPKTESIDVHFLSPGIYLLEFRDAGGRLMGMKKLVKQ